MSSQIAHTMPDAASTPAPASTQPTVQEQDAFFAAETASGRLPADLALQEMDGFYPLFRDWIVDLGDVLSRIEKKKTPLAGVRIYADTLVVPSQLEATLGAFSLVVVARRVVVGDDTRITVDFTREPNASILLCARCVEGPLSIEWRGSGSFARHIELEASSDGVGNLLQPSPDGEPCEPVLLESVPPDLTAQARPFYRLLLGQYQAATVLLSNGLPADAAAMADWVCRVASSNADLVALAVDAATLSSQARSMQTRAPRAPRLSVRVYQSLAHNFVDALAAHESKVHDLESEEKSVQERIDTVQLMLKDAERAGEHDERLIDQTLRSFTHVQRGIYGLENRVRHRYEAIERLKLDLEAEAKKHLIDEIMSAAFQISLHVVTCAATIGAEIIGAVATGGATAPVAIVDAGGKLIKTGEAVIENGAKIIKISFSEGDAKNVNDLSSATGAIAAAGKSLCELGKLVAEIYKIIRTVTDAAERVSQLQNALQGRDFGSVVVSEITGAHYWELMCISARSALKVPIDMGLVCAQKLLDEIESMAEEGRALATQRTSLLELGQEMTRLAWRQEMSQSRLADVGALACKLGESEDALADVTDWARLEAASVKRSIFTALYDYTRAYHYWSLRPSSITPGMVDDTAGYRSTLASMEREIADALARGLVPTPQPFANKEIIVDDSDTVAAVKRGDAVVVRVPLEAPVFRGFARVRVERLRVWLDGAASDGRPLLIEVRSDGSFTDRIGDERLTFTCDPWVFAFEYRPGAGPEGILTDGVSSRRARDLYFMPTPFTEWTIRVRSSDEPGIDLSALSQLRLSFSGDHIYAPEEDPEPRD